MKPPGDDMLAEFYRELNRNHERLRTALLADVWRQAPSPPIRDGRDVHTAERQTPLGREGLRVPRKTMFRIAQVSSVAVALTLLVGAVIWFATGRGRASVVLADTIRNAGEAKSVSFVIKETWSKQTVREYKCFIQDDRLRVEIPDRLVFVEDLKECKAVYLDLRNKEAARWEVPQHARDELAQHPIEQLQRAKTDDAKFVGNEVVHGRNTQVFCAPTENASLFHTSAKKTKKIYGFPRDLEMTVWVDPQTRLPVRIEIHAAEEPGRIVFEDITWNETFDSAMFSFDIPTGFSEQPVERLRDRFLNRRRQSGSRETRQMTPQEAFQGKR